MDTFLTRRYYFLMMRVRKHWSRIAFLLTLCVLMLVTAQGGRAVEIPSYPAGTRLSFPSAPELRFRLAVEGPSVLWIRAESPHLLSLKAESQEAGSSIQAANGKAECALPVYDRGTVQVTITAVGMGGDIVLTTAYGIGASWDVASVERAMRSSSQGSIPAPAVSAPATVENRPAEPGNAAKPSAESATISSGPAVVSSSAPSVTSTPPVSVTLPVVPDATNAQGIKEIPFLLNPVSIFIGETVLGALPESGEPGFATYRVYIPNRLGFSVEVTGKAHVRVRAEGSIWEMGDYSAATHKVIHAPAPSEGWYLIALRGLGSHAVKVEAAR